MTRAEHEEIRKELADILASTRSKLLGQHPQPSKLVLRVQRLQALYDVWCKELLPA